MKNKEEKKDENNDNDIKKKVSVTAAFAVTDFAIASKKTAVSVFVSVFKFMKIILEVSEKAESEIENLNVFSMINMKRS